MKKILSLILMLVMSVSIVASLVACNEHEHAFAAEWTTDATDHWKKATCEHTDEVSEKAAHSFGADRKCTVCNYEKPVVNTATAEEWAATVTLVDDTDYAANILTTIGNPVTSTQIVDIVIDGKKGLSDTYVGETEAAFLGSLIVDESGDAPVAYVKEAEDDSYVTEAYAPEMKAMLFDTYLVVVHPLVEAINTKFADATYDADNKVYTLTVASITVSELELTDVAYTVSFEDGAAVEVVIEISIAAFDTQNMTITILFDGPGVTLPEVAS